ncbi:MAG: substrate-binding domain-containing protein [Isosphaeraceae bacterium]|nr:substrate-binding domain-containing protein [Isosphaeraceae bacterium]
MTDVRDWVGQEIAEGRYKVLRRIGEGSMGHVYRAYDAHLETDVVLKIPVSADASLAGDEFLERFGREIRSLVRLSHPHIVKVIDVGQALGRPYVVMQYLAGGSLKDRLESGPQGEPRPLPAASLRDWLLDVARALDFIHEQRHIHRDVKPANILFDGHGNAFLGDFGIIKALTADGREWQDNSLTAPGFLLGTPNYVAPEIVMGRPIDGRVDQYALAMTVHEVLAGRNFMAGPTPSATVVNQTILPPPSLTGVIQGVPKRLSEALVRALAKNPDERFGNCTAFAHEVIAALGTDDHVSPPLPVSATSETQPMPSPSEAAAARASSATPLRWVPGCAACPSCGGPVPARREHAGEHVHCAYCRAVAEIEVSPTDTLRLKLLYTFPPDVSDGSAVPVLYGPDDEPAADASVPTLLTPHVGAVSLRVPAAPPRRRLAGRRTALAALAGIGLLSGLAAILAARGPWGGTNAGPAAASDGATTPGALAAASAPPPVEIHIAYGTEKQKWLEPAVEEFHKTPEGRHVTIHLHGMGSVEGARAVLEGSSKNPIHVWSPASSAYRDVFEREWRVVHGPMSNPIQKAENLALTPMVFVLWKTRYEAFLKKYPKVGFRTIADAMHEAGGWGAIAGKPEWGLFKFGHTHPNKSNSGLQTLALMAYEFSGKERGLTLSDITRPDFQTWLQEFEQGIARPGGGLTHSTGTLMREMVLRGPSQYDALMLYENLAIEYLDAARDRWGELQVVYPEPNLWNEHPYYILDVPWSTAPQHAAAGRFLTFLMSPEVQRRALDHGFRPGNPSVPLRFAESPLVRHEAQGLRIDMPRMAEPPAAEVVDDLLASFRRVEPR